MCQDGQSTWKQEPKWEPLPPGSVEVISELARNSPELVVGAGTVLDVENARRCLDAGAKFLTSPGLDLEMVAFAVKQKTVVFPGAMTPTEVMAAWKAGSDFVKVFRSAVPITSRR